MENNITKTSRPSWDEYFMKLAEVVGERATCDRGKSGCVITKDKHIVSTGYVGAPRGVVHCDEAGHEFQQMMTEDGQVSQHCVRTTHAEQNAIAQAARMSGGLDGSTLYCHMTPCYACAKMIINAGIVRVVANKDYHRGQRSKDIFKEAGVEFELLHPEMETYAKM